MFNDPIGGVSTEWQTRHVPWAPLW